MPLLDVKNLRVRFETHHGTVKAVDGVSFQLEEGETLGLVGESGSGKSVTNLALMGLIPTPPGVVQAESVRFGKRDLLKIGEDELRRLRGNEIAMIFQDPMTSLNPLLTVERQLTEVLVLHKGMTRREARKQAAAGLGDVGIPNPEERLDAYPHELSGGMRQRVMIAMGLLCKPRVLIADEPTTALDVTIQAQILELMKDLQHKHGMAIILVTHDLGVVAGMTDRINVMYAGRLAETAGCEELFARPMHPYTRGLLHSVPTLGGDVSADLFSIPGSPPDLADLPLGCAFESRCEARSPRCGEAPPTLKAFKDPETGGPRRAACFELDLTEEADPNRELFEALERKEREGVDSSVVSWTPEEAPEPTSGPFDDDPIPGLMGGTGFGEPTGPAPPKIEFVPDEQLGLTQRSKDEDGILAEAEEPPEPAHSEIASASFATPEPAAAAKDEGDLFEDMDASLEELEGDQPHAPDSSTESGSDPAPKDDAGSGGLDLTDFEEELEGEDWKWIGEPPLPGEKPDEKPEDKP